MTWTHWRPAGSVVSGVVDGMVSRVLRVSVGVSPTIVLQETNTTAIMLVRRALFMGMGTGAEG
ncbi:MAG TPA: hypothetical protein VF083_07310 [Acidimicrobiia bacterium]